MVSIRARELLFKTNFQIWQSGGEEEAFQGASPLPPPRGLQLVKGYEDELGGKKKSTSKPPQKVVWVVTWKKAELRSREGFATFVLQNEGGEAAQRPPVAAPVLGGEGVGAPERRMAMDTAIPPRTAATRVCFLHVRGFSSKLPT